MKEVIEHCDRIMELIDRDYPRQKEYSGIIRKIYMTFQELKEDVENGNGVTKKINWTSLVRCFIDDTTNSASPILDEMGELHRILDEEMREKDAR